MTGDENRKKDAFHPIRSDAEWDESRFLSPGEKRKSAGSVLIPLCIAAGACAVCVGGIRYAQYRYRNSKQVRFEAQIDVADEYLRNHEYEKAVDAYEEAMTIMPESGRDSLAQIKKAYLQLVQEYESAKEWESAVKVLDEALAILPDDSDLLEKEKEIYLEWNDEYLDGGDLEGSLALLQQAASKFDDDDITYEIARVEEQQKTKELENLLGSDADAIINLSSRLLQLKNQGSYSTMSAIMRQETELDTLRAIQNIADSDGKLVLTTTAGTIGFYSCSAQTYYAAVPVASAITQDDTQAGDPSGTDTDSLSEAEESILPEGYAESAAEGTFSPKYYFTVYFGDFDDNEEREGSGILFAADAQSDGEDYYIAEGSFSDDAPEGNFTVSISLGDGITNSLYGVIRHMTYKVSLSQGLFNGTAQLIDIYSDGSTQTIYPDFSYGFVTKPESGGDNTVYIDEDGMEYTSDMNLLAAFGVPGYGEEICLMFE